MSINGHPSEWRIYNPFMDPDSEGATRGDRPPNLGSQGVQAPGRKGDGSISGHPSEWGKMFFNIPATLRVPGLVPLAHNRGVSRVVILRGKKGVGPYAGSLLNWVK